MSTVFVVGAGTVGHATGVALSQQGHQVEFVDTLASRRGELAAAGWKTSERLTPQSGLNTVFLCLPTPVGADGYDLSELRQCVLEVTDLATQPGISIDIVVRSTVPPGTCDTYLRTLIDDRFDSTAAQRVSVVHCPEFLREAHALDDALNPRSIVIGSTDPSARERVAALMASGDTPLEVFDTATAAELVKCAHNAYNAAKISFWNEIDILARRVQVDSHSIARVVSHTAEASWNPDYGTRGGAAYGGACLPKDVLGLIAAFRSLGVDPVVLSAVHERNALMAADPP